MLGLEGSRTGLVLYVWAIVLRNDISHHHLGLKVMPGWFSLKKYSQELSS